MNRSTFGSTLLGTLAAFTVAMPAWASPEAGHGGGGGGIDIKWWGGATDDDPRIGVLILFINFVALMFVLNKLLFQKLKAGQVKKSDTIRSQLDKATEAREEAEKARDAYKAKVEALEEETADIKKAAAAAAERDKEKILAEAREAAQQIKANAKMQAEREARALRAELEAEVVDRAIGAAEEAIKRSFGDADQRRIVDAHVDDLSGASLEDAR